MEIRRRIAVVLLSVGALLPAQTVHGRLVDVDGDPLAGISVLSGQDETLAVTSAVDGTFAIDVPWIGRRSLSVRGRGVATATLEVPDDGILGDVAFEASALLVGRVTDADGEPVEAAFVLAYDGLEPHEWLRVNAPVNAVSFRASARTDARGAFRVAGALRHAVVVHVRAGGFETARIGPVSADVPVDVVLRRVPGPRPAAAAARPVSYGVRAIDGRTGQPIERFRVGVFADLVDGKPDRPVRVAIHVARRLQPARAGAFARAAEDAAAMELRATGFARARVRLDTPGEVREVRLEPEAVIHGRVVDAVSGAAVPGCGIRVVPGTITDEGRGQRLPLGDLSLEEAPIEAWTNAAGAFSVRQLAAGAWTLVATHPERRPTGPIHVVLDAGEEREGLEVRSDAGPQLRLRLTGAPVDTRWFVRAAGGRPPGRLGSQWAGVVDGARRVGAGGAVVIGSLEPGAHDLELLVPQPPRMGGFRKIDLGQVVLGDATVQREVDLGAFGPARLHGAVRIDGAAPPRDRLCVVAETVVEHNLRYHRLHLEGPMARVGRAGRFELRAEPGDYTLLVLDTSTRVVLHRVDGVTVERGDRPVDVGELRFAARRLQLRLAGPGAIAVDRLEVRLGELWPAGVGAILGPNHPLSRDRDRGVGVPIVRQRPGTEVWLPASAVELIARGGPTTVMAVPAANASGDPVVEAVMDIHAR